jgi:hypothetical protein
MIGVRHENDLVALAAASVVMNLSGATQHMAHAAPPQSQLGQTLHPRAHSSPRMKCRAGTGRAVLNVLYLFCSE